MKAEEFKFLGANGVMLPGIIWRPICDPTMVVQTPLPATVRRRRQSIQWSFCPTYRPYTAR